MDLTPGEKTVLAQIRVLYAATSGRDQQLKALRMQWPPVHCEAYQKAYGLLLAKELIQDLGTQVFRITDAGLKAIGVTAAAPPRTPARPIVEVRPAPQVNSRDVGTPRGNLLSRFMRGLLRKNPGEKSAGR